MLIKDIAPDFLEKLALEPAMKILRILEEIESAEVYNGDNGFETMGDMYAAPVVYIENETLSLEDGLVQLFKEQFGILMHLRSQKMHSMIYFSSLLSSTVVAFQVDYRTAEIIVGKRLVYDKSEINFEALLALDDFKPSYLE